MKTILRLLTFVLFILIFASCKDEEPQPDYYFRFKVDGVQKEFRATSDAGVVFLDEPSSEHKITLLTMVSESDPNVNSLVISLRSTDRIETGIEYEMQDPLTVNDVDIARIALVYFDENKNAFGATKLNDESGVRDDAKVRFSQISTAGSYGTFSAVTFDMEDTGELGARTAVLITDGEFFLPVFASLI